MTHPLEDEFLTICQAALEEEWNPAAMRLGSPIIGADGSLMPVLLGVEPGRRVLAGKPEHYRRFDRQLLVGLAAATTRERSRKIRNGDARGMAA